jgi:hypothetical protein
MHSLCAADQSTSSPQSVVVSVQPAKAYRASGAIELTIEIKNPSSEPLALTTIRGREPFNLRIYNDAGKRINPRGAVVSASGAPASTLHFEPGETKAFNARVATRKDEHGQEYRITPGRYEVIATVPVVTKDGDHYKTALAKSSRVTIEVK